MEITVTKLSGKALRKRDYKDILMISFDKDIVFSVYDGEPEDNFLYRNFNDCYNIIDIIKRAYELGIKNKSLTIKNELLDEW